MELKIKICDHCGSRADTMIHEFKTVGLELCSDCEPLLIEYFEAFGRVDRTTATVHFKTGELKQI